MRVNGITILYLRCPRLSGSMPAGALPDTAAWKQLALSATAGRSEGIPVVLTSRTEPGSTEYSGFWNEGSQFLFGLKYWTASSAYCPADLRLPTHSWFYKQCCLPNY